MQRAAIALALALVGGACGDDSASGDGGTTEGATGTSGTAGPGDDGGEAPATDTAGDDNPATGDTSSVDDDPSADDTASADDDTSADGGSSTGGDDGPNVDVSDPQLYEFGLDPTDLDPTVVINLETMYAQLDTTAEPIGKLVMFLPGYTNTPGNWRDHGRQIAGHGFHVVIPDYSNDWDCSGGPDNCDQDTRWEALQGEDVSSIVDISRADSAEGRVVTILEYLIDEHPGGDWGYYLDGEGSIRYEDVIIAGISHGAASTGLFASRRPFHRAVMHSGGYWAVPADPMTPITEWYGLAHSDDPQYDGILSSWGSAMLPGAPTSIDGMDPPYGDAHQLTTGAPNGYPHCSTCVSGDSPMDGSGYVFDPAWRHMYGAPQL